MKFRNRTALGISTTHYEDTANTLLRTNIDVYQFYYHGLLRGRGRRNDYDRHGKTKQSTQWIDGYDDDTLIFFTIEERHDETVNPAQLAAQLQRNTQEWKILLAATRGKLAH
jgi:hypothetical protein